MEALTRLVTESLARHGFDRPLDYRRLRWSRWFRCESHHSLLFVPSKPGVFAIAEEIADLVEERRFSAASSVQQGSASAAEGVAHTEDAAPRRMLAVTQFFEDDDMAFTLDRMLSLQNPMRARLLSGRYFVRFVVIEDPSQRRSICNALNQWIADSAEKASGIGSLFAQSLELTREEVGTANVETSHVATGASPVPRPRSGAAPGTPASVVEQHGSTAPQLHDGAATNIHCPSPFPSGF